MSWSQVKVAEKWHPPQLRRWDFCIRSTGGVSRPSSLWTATRTCPRCTARQLAASGLYLRCHSKMFASSASFMSNESIVPYWILYLKNVSEQMWKAGCTDALWCFESSQFLLPCFWSWGTIDLSHNQEIHLPPSDLRLKWAAKLRSWREKMLSESTSCCWSHNIPWCSHSSLFFHKVCSFFDPPSTEWWFAQQQEIAKSGC